MLGEDAIREALGTDNPQTFRTRLINDAHELQLKMMQMGFTGELEITLNPQDYHRLCAYTKPEDHSVQSGRLEARLGDVRFVRGSH